MTDLEDLWESLLSEEPPRIRAVWEELTDDECELVAAHLKRMATEEGWHPLQRQAASKALEVIQTIG
jgi:cytochrome c553